MINELDRKILKTILEAKKPVPNKDLALRCDAAINTIRKEIMIINEEAQKHGFCIASKTSVGNYIEMTNPDVAIPYLEWLRDRYKRNQRMDNHYPPRIYYLARRCLCSTGNLSIEGLCQELYCSRGSLLRDLDKVKQILQRYDLALKTRRGKQGLVVEGNEWNLRQCLVYQHKIWKNQIEEEEHKEYDFKNMFFMLEGIDHYELARKELVSCLRDQKDFAIPVIHYPKIIHYMQLSVTRQKYTSQIVFTPEQIARAKGTPEYGVATRLYERQALHLRSRISEQDILAVTMLLLSYESKNHMLKYSAEYEEYYQETQELVQEFVSLWGYPREIFDDEFVEDWACFLYRLRNCQVFGVYLDREAMGDVVHKGIRSADFCITFSRFYERKHGIRLTHQETISAFYFFHRLLKRDDYCYYAQNVLVVSQYGIPCAKSLAMNIRSGYGKEVKMVTACEVGEHMEDEQEVFDLLMTDLGPGRIRYLEGYGMPILPVDFLPFHYRCPELDEYLRKVQRECEWMVIKEKSFFRTNFKSKKEVFTCFAELMEDTGLRKEDAILHLEENDAYVDLERECGVVFLPILLPEIKEQRFYVLINRRAFVWNENKSQIFVCYNRIDSLKANQILNGILKRFIHMPVETAHQLCHSNEALLDVLYTKEVDTHIGQR